MQRDITVQTMRVVDKNTFPSQGTEMGLQGANVTSDWHLLLCVKQRGTKDFFP